MKKNIIQVKLTIREISTPDGNVYRVVCSSDRPLGKIAAGQFAHIEVPGRDLRRPICVYDNTDSEITFIIAGVGKGTADFLKQKAGDVFEALLPLGNGFPILPDRTNIALLGGGTGFAPLYKIAKDNPSLNCTALFGFPNAAAREVYGDDFDRVCNRVCYCTDDGSLGYHGYPTDMLTEIAPEVLYVCGAPGMVKTAQQYCKSHGVIGFVTVEQRMGCGVGACLVCSMPIRVDGEEKMLRACADGPVFPIEDVIL